MTNLLKPLLPRTQDTRIIWQNLPGDSLALAVAEAAMQHEGPIVVLQTDSLSAAHLADSLTCFLPDAVPLLQFPDWETLPYDCFSPNEIIVSERIQTLAQLAYLKQGILLLSVTCAMQRLAPPAHIQGHSFTMQRGDKLKLDDFRQRLQRYGYRCVTQVMEHGEFAVRGSLLDLFPMGSELPYRIDLFADEIDSIRSFDPDNQLSIENLSHIQLLPAKEYPLNDDGISCFRQQWRETFGGNPSKCPLYQDVSQGQASAGLEYYLPLFFQQTATLFDYLPANSLIIRQHNVPQAADQFWQQILARYEQLSHDRLRPILPPPTLFLPTQQLFEQLHAFPQVHLSHANQTGAGRYQFELAPLPDLRIDNKHEQPFHALQSFLHSYSGRLLFCAESAGRREVLLELVRGLELEIKPYDSWQAFLEDNAPIGIIVARLDTGFQLLTANITLLAENQLVGQHSSTQHKKHKTATINPNALVRDLLELSIGAPVVHVEHGIGRYLGLENLTINDQTAEFISLEYADANKVYVPVTSLHLINRYTGSDPDTIVLHQLGSKQWQKARRKASEKIHDVAAELLDIYARRAAKPGVAFPAPDENYYRFANSFAFAETPDQARAIDEVINDMQSPRCMERLICGDVGFGKTEVAVRAAFLAAYAGKQVAIFVPTTLLAQQHYATFSDRFADWPIKIATLSRFKTAKEQKELIEQLKLGRIDIVIGTHRLLSNEIQFKELGLLIIDEEHRFGVRHKEQIRALRSNIDTLTLTATPIPRTLNMAFSGIRDLSLIATPPAKRLAIKTFVHERQDNLIREAISREANRGGQIYFLHNSVDTIEKTGAELQALMPTCRIAIAHGQMPERQLERVMYDFYHQHFHILLCTTIIESGIDVPSANTIIIDKAERFGLSQLHQIRGRVGRSHHQAYAYLLTGPEKSLTPDAKKRLDALTSLDDLGAGFTLATHDLEIRGAGELLGEQQSGHIQAIGFSLYTDLLNRAVAALKAGKTPDFDAPLALDAEIDLQIPALIPNDYVADVHLRLTLYKRISNAATTTELDELKVEFIDRFGNLPIATEQLFQVTALKLQAKPLGIRKIEANAKAGRLEFHSQPNIDPMLIIQLVQQKPEHYQLEGAEKLRFRFAMPEAKQRLQTVKSILQLLTLGPTI